MQTLWSRVAQVRGACRCPQCAPSVHGVTRRATASATRRMPRYFTTSTFLYSGIFAAAATIDAGQKQQRRDKWDKAIAEVTQELTRQDRDGAFDLHMGEELEDAPALFRPFAEDDRLDEFQYMDGQSRAAWPANTGAPLTRFLAPNSVYADDKQRAIAELSRWTPKKLATVQTSMDILLLELMNELCLENRGYLTDDSLLRELQFAMMQDSNTMRTRISEKYRRLKVLRNADADLTHYTQPDTPGERLPIPEDQHPICSYTEDRDRRFRSTQKDLNMSLQHLFRMHAREEISGPTMVGKIIYNLRSSSAPPNMDTYNTLLLGFSKADEPSSFSRVLRSFRRCHMRPNEITLATVLNHFTKTDDPAGFVFWIQLIRGGQGGLALARADVEINEESSKRLIHHPDNLEKIIQLPHHNPLVFGAMIAGVLKFSGFEPALQICEKMGQEGWGLCMAGLTPLLHDCVRRSDWNTGMAVWKQIEALKANSRHREDSRWLSERIRLDTYAAMLRLCLKCDRRDSFDDIWGLALRSHRGATEKLRLLIKGAGSTSSGNVVEKSVSEALIGEREAEREIREKARRASRRAKRLRERKQQWKVRPSEVDLPDQLLLDSMERLVLANDDVLQSSVLDDMAPSHQADLHPQGREWDAGVLKQPAFLERLVLRNEDVLASSEMEDVLPRYQSIDYHQPQHVDSEYTALRLALGNEDLLASSSETSLHQTDLDFAKRTLYVEAQDAADRPSPKVRTSRHDLAAMALADYFECAERDPEDASTSLASPAAESAARKSKSKKWKKAKESTLSPAEREQRQFQLLREQWSNGSATPTSKPAASQPKIPGEEPTSSGSDGQPEQRPPRRLVRRYWSHGPAQLDTPLEERRPRVRPAGSPRQVSLEELRGLARSSAELEEYEVRERPMSLRA